MYSEIPSQVQGQEGFYKRLWYSNPANALMRDVTISAGYGVLRAGTALAKNVSAAGNVGQYVPYCPTVPDSSSEVQQGNAFIVTDGAANAYVYVTKNDSYKFVVGDDLIAYDTDTATTSAIELGAITAIDRTTYVHMAKITVTANLTTGITVALSGAVHVECGADSSNGFSDCAGILASSVDTGTGENAQGALAPMIMSNAVLYSGACENLDTAGKTDISATANGNLLVIK
jgi:hypothetical protein